MSFKAKYKEGYDAHIWGAIPLSFAKKIVILLPNCSENYAEGGRLKGPVPI